MRVWQLVLGTLALGAAGGASAAVALGQPLGFALGLPLGIGLGTFLGSTLGLPLGDFLGTPLGAIVPLAGSGVLLVGAASLVFGIYLSRRKRRG